MGVHLRTPRGAGQQQTVSEWCVLHGVGGEAQQAHCHREAQAGTVATRTFRLPISECASLRSFGVSVARPSFSACVSICARPEERVSSRRCRSGVCCMVWAARHSRHTATGRHRPAQWPHVPSACQSPSAPPCAPPVWCRAGRASLPALSAKRTLRTHMGVCDQQVGGEFVSFRFIPHL